MDKELPIEVTMHVGYQRGQVRMDCSKGTELGGNQFINFPAKASVVKWDHKRAAKEKITNCHRSGGAIASAWYKCFFGGKNTRKSLLEFDSYDPVLVAYEESGTQRKKSISTNGIHLPAGTFVCTLWT